MTHEFITNDAPTANGRKPVYGEQQWTFTFTLDNGDTLKVVGGKTSHKAFRQMFEQEEIDDTAEQPIPIGPG